MALEFINDSHDWQTYEKIVLVNNPDGTAGFSALMTDALNGVRLGLLRGWYPIINITRTRTPYFYDPKIGENIWEYYFEPVMSLGTADLHDLQITGQIRDTDIVHFNPAELLHRHHDDPDRIATFWAREDLRDRTEWMAQKRALGQKYVAKYMHVKPQILEKVHRFYSARFEGCYAIGVHIRGTDFAYAEPTSPSVYFARIDQLTEKVGDFQIFLATDQVQFVDFFREKYGRRVLLYDSIRSSSDHPPFKLGDEGAYKKGEDVLIDILLLGKCDHVLKGASAVGEYALWFNPRVEYTDFSLESEFDRRDYHQLTSAYIKLNPGQLNPFRLWLKKAYQGFVNSIRQNQFLVRSYFALIKNKNRMLQRIWQITGKR